MVDYGPHNGNYEYTRVLHNTILIQGAMLKLGIGQGYSCWFGTPSDQPRKYLRGAIVMNNLIDSPEGQGQVGYGFAVTDVENWTCIGNVSGEGVNYDGVATDPPRGGRLKVSPGAFVRSPTTKDGTTGPKGHSNLQSNFVVGNVYSLIGVQPGHSDVRSFSAGQLCLRPGEKITLREIELEFSTDGEVKLVRPFDGTPTWVFNQPYHSVGPSTRLMFMENGKFGIVEDGGRLVVDLTPNLPFSGIHDLPDEPNAKATLTLFGNGGGRLSIMSPNGSLILSAPPFVTTHNYELKPYPSAPFISHPSANGQSTIVTLLSPFGRLVVLETVGGPEMDLPIRFGQKVGEGGQIPVEGRWKVIWSSKEPRKEQVDADGRDEHAKLCFQGDGNLVVYSSKAGPVWSSGTHAVKPVLKWMKFGCGIESDPCIELCDETGKVGWKV
ncbi:hypothetical protein FRC02_005913 [Tulasnella sp. 418]|nr:hypothetical protein FRC02_005913 [Tulasnella sp. 418]